MDKHFGMIVSRLWETVEQADDTGDLKTKASTLKAIADIEKGKVETLQKAGLINDNEMAEEIVQTQERVEKVKELLREVAQKYPQTRSFIMERLSEIFDEAVPVDTKIISGDVVV